MAKHVRLRLERVLPATLGVLARALEAARPRLRERYPDGTDRRRAVDAALCEGGALDPLDPYAFQRVEAWVAGSDDGRRSALFDITLTSADPEDLTLRQARLLGEADILLLDGNVPPAILARARADAARLPWQATETPDLAGLEEVKAASGHQTTNRDAVSATGLTVILRWRPGAAEQV